jgi:putative endonuclease
MQSKDFKIWFLYAVECRNGSIYTGITTDPRRRYIQHSTGKGAKYTKSNPATKMLFAIPQPDHGTALRAEIAFKKLSREKKLIFCNCVNSRYDIT